MDSPIVVQASGRLCLLGEHADYLGLEVISWPLDNHLTMEATPIAGPEWTFQMADLNRERKLLPSPQLMREGSEDYLAAGFQRLLRQGHTFPQAYQVRVSSTIPMGKGVSSSSAFCVAWMDLLHQLASSGKKLEARELAESAYQLEVIDFQQSGGMQDQYAIAYGELIHLQCSQPVKATPLGVELKGFILGDSGQTKDTQGVLSRIRGAVEGATQTLGWPMKKLLEISEQETRHASMSLPEEQKACLIATVMNRDMTRYGLQLLQTDLMEKSNRLELGRLLSEHHHVLASKLKTSTETIDRGLQIAREAGAYGGKVLGSGGGGCFLVYAPHATQAVVARLRQEGYEAREVRP